MNKLKSKRPNVIMGRFIDCDVHVGHKSEPSSVGNGTVVLVQSA